MKRRFWTLPAAAAVAIVMIGTLSLTGCDTLDPGSEPVVLTLPEQTFRFETTRGELEQGAVLTADGPLNISGTLSNFGFGLGDIVGAELQEVVIERVQPVGVSLNAILSSAAVRVALTGSPEITLASSSSMSAAASQPLTLSTVNNLAGVLRAGNAQVRLATQPASSLEHQNYVFRVRLRMRVTVEGL